jgi:tripeptide aminopeptidase
VPTETGNLIVELPGIRPGPPLLFATHLDTVTLWVLAKTGGSELSDGSTALGGDNRRAAPSSATLAVALLKQTPHPSRCCSLYARKAPAWRQTQASCLGGASMCFNVDGRVAPTDHQEPWVWRKSQSGAKLPMPGSLQRRSRPLWLQRSFVRRPTRQAGLGGGETGWQGPQSASSAASTANRRAAPRVGDAAAISQRRGAQPGRVPATGIALGFNGAFKTKLKVKDASGATADVKFHHAGLSAVQPGQGKRGRSARHQGDHIAWPPPTYVFSNGGLDANCSTSTAFRRVWRRPKRNPRGGRVCRPSGVPAGLSSGDRPRDAR